MIKTPGHPWTLLIACLPACGSAVADDPAWIARSKLGMVASDSPEASKIGADVLQNGGNAFDAAVATSFALAVARPQSTGLGGGGFMVAYVAKEDRVVALDFRETAPAAATRERYANLFANRGDGPSPSVYGGNAVAVPGQVAGLVEINKRFGSRPLGKLIDPAIELANSGFVIDQHFVDARQEMLADLEKWPQLRQFAIPLRALLYPRKTELRIGDRFQRPALARGLRVISEQGPDAFYSGAIAEAIVKAVNAAGGSMTRDDLRAYQLKWREPLQCRHYDPFQECEYEFVTMPPPSSGGVCMNEMLNIIAGTMVRSDLNPIDDREHVLIEAEKHAFADRARYLGDPDFADVRVARLMNSHYGALISSQIQYRRAGSPAGYGSACVPVDGPEPFDEEERTAPDDGGTSHFCVADREGNIVAITETINGTFGSLVVAEPYGIILNNEMDDFTTVSGQANLFGLVQSDVNLVAPGKRPLSSMMPTIILRDGKPFLTLGGAGGPRIITSVYQVAQRVMGGESLADAMRALRIHHQWMPDEVYFDREPPADLKATLESYGHKLSDKRKTGVVQAIQFLPDGTMVGASDSRKGGRPAGVGE